MQLTGGLQQRFADEMGALLGPNFPQSIALAVSGGGDSMAMLHLASGWARQMGIELKCATVNHGLRPEAASEAELVAAECAGLNISHTTLNWDGWDGQGNLQDAARQARIDLIGRWLGTSRNVLMGHTQDDQAETFLMRLIRGSGVDGLSGIPAQRIVNGWRIVRPLLSVTRAELRHFNDTLNIPYVDDPSNEDDAFTRVRLRKFLADEGLSTERLCKTQHAMERAQVALERRTLDAANQVRGKKGITGLITFDRDAFSKIETETQLRLFAAALADITNNTYRPRLTALEDSLEKALAGGKSTLHGAMIYPKRENIYIGREYNAVRNEISKVGETRQWDGRFKIFGNEIMGLDVKALGPQGASQVRDHSKTDIPHDLLKALPAIWDEDRLVGFQPLKFGLAYSMARFPTNKVFPFG